MPDFDASTWESFKQQFLSVIQWLLYCLKIIFNSARAHPMLYAFVFFPLFAVAFFTIFDFITHVVPVSSFLEGSDVNTDNSMFKNLSATNNREVKARNLNQFVSQAGSRGAGVKENGHGSAKSHGLGSAQAHGFGSVKSSGFGSAKQNPLNGSAGGSVKEAHAGQGAVKYGERVGKNIADAIGEAKKSRDKKFNDELDARLKADMEAQKQQEKDDRAYNMYTVQDIYHNDDGSTRIETETTNQRTGEIVGTGEKLVRHHKEQ